MGQGACVYRAVCFGLFRPIDWELDICGIYIYFFWSFISFKLRHKDPIERTRTMRRGVANNIMAISITQRILLHKTNSHLMQGLNVEKL